MFRWKNLLGGLFFLLGALVIGILQIPIVSGMASGVLSAIGIIFIVAKSFFPRKTFLDVFKIMEKFGYKKFVNIMLGGLILSVVAFFYFFANPNNSFISTFFSTFFFAIFMVTAMTLAPIGIHHEEWLELIRRQEKEKKD